MSEFTLRVIQSLACIVCYSISERALAQCRSHRPLLSLAVPKNEAELIRALDKEEKLERSADRIYWEPLRKELEALRHPMNKTAHL